MRSSDYRRLELLRPPPRRNSGRGKVTAAINVTPLVDVVLVLLIIFMVVTPLLARRIELPKVVGPSPWASPSDELRIAIDAAGTIQVQNETVAADALPLRIDRELRKSTIRPVMLEADRTLPFASVRTILEALRDAGAGQVALASTPLGEEKR
jgi:biopolymer transport protein TolR